MSDARETTVAIAGASGFVGRALCRRIGEGRRVVGLGRGSEPPEAIAERCASWRQTDLFSARQTRAALRGADVAVYLVHSMMPSARLTQASFADLDLILADNFARAAAAAGVERIVYLGGLVPSSGELSPHLASRLEVEEALASTGIPLTAVRASLVVGANGSSLEMMLRLVERLPAMVLPSWTQTPTQPVALDDLVRVLDRCLDAPEVRGRVVEVGGPEVMTYAEMLERSAEALGLRRLHLRVPVLTPKLSRLWVRLVTGTPKALVDPLVESLLHPMVVDDPHLQRELGEPRRSFDDALREAVEGRQDRGQSERRRRRGRARLRRASQVRSVQRLPLPHGCDASWVAREYPRWLSAQLGVLLHAEIGPGPLDCAFHAPGLRTPLLELRYRPERSGPERAMFEVHGGLLAAHDGGDGGRLEFRVSPTSDEILAAVHEFRPALPWWIYQPTQAQVHLAVMRSFGRHLGNVRRAQADESVELEPLFNSRG